MLCSNCNEIIKPVVAVDIDGTLGDYHEHFIEFAEAWLGRMLPRARDYTGSQPFKSWFNEACGVGHDEWHQIKLAYRQGGMKRSMPIFDGAAALCASIRAAGAELWLTTTRPYLSLDNIVPDTVAWLDRHGIDYDGMLFDEDKYAQLAKRVDGRRVVAILDDLPEMYEAAAQTFSEHPYSYHVPILFINTYNSAVAAQYFGAISLFDARRIIRERITYWKEGHA